MQTYTAALVASSSCQLGEGPIWDDARQVLWFIDILGDRLLSWRPQTSDLVEVATPKNPSAVMFGPDKTLLVPARDGLYSYEADTQTWKHRLKFQTDPEVRSNDAAVDPWGQPLCGTMHETALPSKGALYRLQADGSVQTLLESVTISNGLDWSPDHTVMYYVDTRTQRVMAYPYRPTGPLGTGAVVVEFDDELGHPDGMTVDQSGDLWVALWGAGAVHQISPAGETLSVVDVPAPYVSSCSFGGRNLCDLYISTAGSDPVTDDPDPATGGDLYLCEGIGQGRVPFRSELKPSNWSR